MNLSGLTHEEQVKLKEYLSSIQEIQKEVDSLLEKCGYKLGESSGGNMSSGLVMPVEEEPINENKSKNRKNSKAFSKMFESKELANDFIERFDAFNIETSRKKSQDNKYIVKFWL
jgi:hypothetical protein